MPDNTIEHNLKSLAEQISNLRKEFSQRPSVIERLTIPDNASCYNLIAEESVYHEFDRGDKEAYIAASGFVLIGDTVITDVIPGKFAEGRILALTRDSFFLNIKGVQGIWIFAVNSSYVVVSSWKPR